MSRINNQQKESFSKKSRIQQKLHVRSIQQKSVLTHSSKTARIHKNNKKDG